MNPVIIACGTLQRELSAAMEAGSCQYPVIWLEAGMHNLPDARRAQIQNALDSIQGHDTVLLAMTLCGGSVAGLRTGDFQLVIPRCQDCISLLLGSEECRKDLSGTYFLTEGWLNGSQSMAKEYQHCLEKYGPARTERIFSGMLKHYHTLAMVDTGVPQDSGTEAEIRQLADAWNLEFRRMEGTIRWLTELLKGEWDESRFVVVPPHGQVPPHL